MPSSKQKKKKTEKEKDKKTEEDQSYHFILRESGI